MDKHKKMAGLFLAAGVIGTFVVLAVIGLVVVYTGSYNIAATEEHAFFTRWAFDTTFRNSVERRADDLPLPERLSRK